MINFLKNLFKKESDIILTKKDNNTVLNIKGNFYPCSIKVSDNNVSKFTNIMSIDEIVSGLIFSNFSIIKTSERFKNSKNIDDIIALLGNEYISMTNSNFDFSFIFGLGNNVSIPANGISVDKDVFEIIKTLKNKILIVKDIDNYQNNIIERNIVIDLHEKAGTKICGCKNKGKV